VVICLERGAELHMAQLIPLPLTVSCFSKIQIGLPFWYRLTHVVMVKGPLNGCVCVCVCDNTVSALFGRFMHFCLELGTPAHGGQAGLCPACPPHCYATTANRTGDLNLPSASRSVDRNNWARPTSVIHRARRDVTSGWVA